MNIDQENHAGQVLSVAKARRAGWLRFGVKKTPAWFSGRELEVLEQGERDRLYRQFSSKFKAAWPVLFVTLMANAFTIARGLHLARGRWVWIVLLSGYTLLVLGAWLYNRRALLNAARRSVRESGDWPLRSQGHVF